jgi:hypothetical protein
MRYIQQKSNKHGELFLLYKNEIIENTFITQILLLTLTRTRSAFVYTIQSRIFILCEIRY